MKLPLAMGILGLTVLFAAPVQAQGNPVSVNLGTQNASGISGTATLTQMGADLKVVINATGTKAGSIHPVHIHTGVCPSPGAVHHALTNIVDGTSTTTLAGVTLASVTDGNHAINAHESPENLTAPGYVACGNIAAVMAANTPTAGATMAPASTPATGTTQGSGTTPQTLPKTGGETTNWLLIAGLAAMAGGLLVRRKVGAVR